MAPYDVTYANVPDEVVSALLNATNALGLGTPLLSPVGGRPPQSAVVGGKTRALVKAHQLNGDADLPDEWTQVREMHNQQYAWPTIREDYHDYRVYAGTTVREGVVHIALGHTTRKNAWGRDRRYIIAFLSSGAPQTALGEFLETDGYEDKHEYVAVIRGSDGAKRMYGPGDRLPQAYIDHFMTVLYRDHIDARGAYSKMGVLAHEEDTATMLNHALLQARRRGDL
jgi:hypothetical protein